MNNNQTVEKLRKMRIGAMAELHLQHVAYSCHFGQSVPLKADTQS